MDYSYLNQAGFDPAMSAAVAAADNSFYGDLVRKLDLFERFSKYNEFCFWTSRPHVQVLVQWWVANMPPRWADTTRHRRWGPQPTSTILHPEWDHPRSAGWSDRGHRSTTDPPRAFSVHPWVSIVSSFLQFHFYFPSSVFLDYREEEEAVLFFVLEMPLYVSGWCMIRKKAILSNWPHGCAAWLASNMLLRIDMENCLRWLDSHSLATQSGTVDEK